MHSAGGDRACWSQAYLDPSIWVAALGSPLEFDVRRASYTSPITITQILHTPGAGPDHEFTAGSLSWL